MLLCWLSKTTIKTSINDKFLLMLITVSSDLLENKLLAESFSKKAIGLNVNNLIVVGIYGDS
jgi:hypothetical protein